MAPVRARSADAGAAGVSQPLALFPRPRLRKPHRPRTVFAKTLAARDVDARTPLGLRRNGWDLVAVVDRALAYPYARVVLHVGSGGEVLCGALGGVYPVEGERRDVLPVMAWLARLFPVCERCAVALRRGYKQHGAGRPPRERAAVLTARFRNGALPEQAVRPTHVLCSRCNGRGLVRVTYAGEVIDEERTCIRCRGTGVYPPREIAS